MLTLPPTLTRDTLATTTRTVFDTFNAPGLCIAEEAQVSAYAAGVLTATVIDVGWEHCTISPVLEQSGVVSHAVTRSDVGLRHVAVYLAHLLSKDESVVQALITLDARRSARGETGTDSSGDLLAVRLFELAIHLISQGKVQATLQGEGYANKVAREDEEEAEFDIAAALVAGRERAAIEEQDRKNRAALEASNREATQGVAPNNQGQAGLLADKDGQAQSGASKEEGSETVQFQGITIRVGPGPLTQACEPLWDPSVLSSLRGKLAASATSSLGPLDLGSAEIHSDYSTLRSLTETIASCIAAATEPERRAHLWETLLATGAPAKLLQNFPSVLVAACQTCLASTTGADQGQGPTSALVGIASGGVSRDSPGIGGGLEDTSQPTTARSIKTPDYFAEFKDRTDLAPFLGATIYAKLAFTDPYGRLVTSKAVYNEKGPPATFMVSAPS
jgi:actin-related protein 9